MKYKSVFDIIGPIMIGPSSSHTAGVVKIGRLARLLFGGSPEKADIYLFGSFAQTYRGHATDVAIVGGLLGFDTNDERIRNAIDYATNQGIKIQFIPDNREQHHPNTLTLELYKGDKHMSITGVSLGGGAAAITQINSFPINLSGDLPTILVLHHDYYGVIASVAGTIAKHNINIANMNVSRSDKGGEALTIIESDEAIDETVIDEICNLDNILWAKIIKM